MDGDHVMDGDNVMEDDDVMDDDNNVMVDDRVMDDDNVVDDDNTQHIVITCPIFKCHHLYTSTSNRMLNMLWAQVVLFAKKGGSTHVLGMG